MYTVDTSTVQNHVSKTSPFSNEVVAKGALLSKVGPPIFMQWYTALC